MTSRSLILAANVLGNIPIEEWQSAFRTIQKRYPILSASIEKQPGERPFFYEVVAREIPICFSPMTEDFSLEKAVENELLISFCSGESSLIRATVFHRDNRCAIMLASHHAALDGRSHLYILRDLLTVLAGEQLPTKKPIMQPRTSMLYGRSLSPYQRLADIKQEEAFYSAVHAIPPIHITRHLVSSEDLEGVRAACKKEGVSVHCALLVALAKAGARQTSLWNPGENSMPNPRQYPGEVSVERCCGNVTDSTRTLLLMDRKPFWAEARRVYRSLKAEALHSSSPAFLDVADQLVSEEHSPSSHIDVLKGSKFNHDLMLTNYGVLEIPMTIGPLSY